VSDVNPEIEALVDDGVIRTVKAGPNQWYVAPAGGTPELLDAVTDAEALTRSAASPLTNQFAAIRSLQDRLWDMRRPSLAGPGGERVGGVGDMKWVASIPPEVAHMAELVEPQLFKDPKIFYAWLTKHPEYGTRRRH
jgi:hypothetical protein